MSTFSHGVSRTAIQQKTEQQKAKEQEKIDAYRALVADFNERASKQDYSDETFNLTTTLLKQNPEYYTVWNHRRRILLQRFKHDTDSDVNEKYIARVSSLVETDLSFQIPLLKVFPKCYWIWNHRSWLLSQAELNLPSDVAIKFWRQELALTNMMLNKDTRNFHGWGYRRTVIEAIEKLSGQSMVDEEAAYTLKMIQSNLSNFSACHYRINALRRKLDEQSASHEERKKVLQKELDWVEEAVWVDSDNQSAWFYLQSLCVALSSAKAAESLAPELSKEERLDLPKDLIARFLNLLDEEKKCKWIYLALIDLARTYQSTTGSWPDNADISRIGEWMSRIEELDPLRAGRWKEMRQTLDLSP